MQTPRRDIPTAELPWALVFTTALTCGVLAALAVQTYLAHAGFDLAALWQNLLDGGTRELRTTGPWWAIAGAAFVSGGVVAAALSHLPLPWRGLRPLRWIAGGIFVLLLAHIGHSEPAASDSVGPGVRVAAALSALIMAAFFAALGVFLALRR
jgi:hypothetical protein